MSSTVGKLIVIEGISASGKSTTTKSIEAYHNNREIPFEYSHGACSATTYGKQLKKFMKDEEITYKNGIEVIHRFVADIVQMTLKQIRPKLDAGINIIQDRYFLSVLAYYLFLDEVNGTRSKIDEVIDLYKDLNLILRPSYTFICLASKKEILERLTARRTGMKFSPIHEQYIRRPELVDIHQKYFVAYSEDKTDKTLFINTSNIYENIELLEQKHNIIKPIELWKVLDDIYDK